MKYFRFVPSVVVALLLVGATASAQVGRSVRGEHCERMYNPCCDGGAGIDFCFTINTVMDQNGEIANVTLHGTGVGESGQKYILGYAEHSRVNVNENNGATTHTEMVTLRMNAAGSDCGFTVRIQVHITTNANGDVTVEFSNESIECENDTDLS